MRPGSVDRWRRTRRRATARIDGGRGAGRHNLIGWLVVLVLLVAGCTSGPGPLSAPTLDQGSVFGTATAWLVENGDLPGGPVFVLDASDPTLVAWVTEGGAEAGDVLDGPGPVDGKLGADAQSAIRDALEATSTVEFVATAEDARTGSTTIAGHECPNVRDDGAILRMASARTLSVHGDVVLVALGIDFGCRQQGWMLRLGWEQGSPFGGRWTIIGVSEPLQVSP